MNAPLIVVAGPTGSGKSGLAVDLALAFGGEVVNCDSVQVYRHLNIGAAKLPEAERQGVPHHLIDVVEPDQVFTAGEYLRLGRSVLNQIRERRRIPIVTGGTGLYLKALLEGLFGSATIRIIAGQAKPPCGAKRFNLSASFAVTSRSQFGQKHLTKRQAKNNSCVWKCTFSLPVPISQHFTLGRDPLQGFRSTPNRIEPTAPATL